MRNGAQLALKAGSRVKPAGFDSSIFRKHQTAGCIQWGDGRASSNSWVKSPSKPIHARPWHVVKLPPFFLPQAKEHTMKIIVTGSPTTGPMNAQYEAPRWEVNQDGELIIFGDNDKVVGTHAPGTWAHVRGYAEEK